MMESPYDVVVVGGGPVGLYAGYRAALLRLRARIADKGRKWGRGFRVPRYHNVPTHYGGISGKSLIEELRKNISDHPDYVKIDDFVQIDTVRREGQAFLLEGVYHPTGEPRKYAARSLILATGVVDRQPVIGGEIANIFPYANRGLICYCEICDGFLSEGKSLAIIGSGAMALHLAADLGSFNVESITILTNGKGLVEDQEDSGETAVLAKRVQGNGVEVREEVIESLFGAKEGFFGVRLGDGRELKFDMAFSAMGMYHINNELAKMIGGQIDKDGYCVVDENCRLLDPAGEVIHGVYAIGDLNYNWNQVMIGFGDADRAIIHAWAEYL